jgi:hypothetical protein
MAKHDSSDPEFGRREGTRDPALELFGRGWTPEPEPARESYTGRHRAPDA